MRIDVNAVKNFKTLHVSERLLFLIFSIACADGGFRLKISDLANRAGTSERTARTYLKNYVDCDVLKLKYSGTGRINPNFYYTGELSKFSDARKEYADFKSDF